MRSFNNIRLGMMYGLFEEFDQMTSNDALEAFRDSFSPSERNANNILFDYFNAFLSMCEDEGIDLDYTYETLSNLPTAIKRLEERLSKRYIESKVQDQKEKTLAAYLIVLAANVHDLDIVYKSNGPWANKYKILINGTDLLEVCQKSSSDLNEIARVYKTITNIDLLKSLRFLVD